MSVSLWVWGATLIGLLAVLALDLFVIGRKPHAVSLREAGTWVALMAALAVSFGIGLSHLAGPTYGGQFLAGWITEYSLSVDNLFVFVIIMARFKVPREFQHRVLLIGVLVALGLRGVFIGLGSAIVSTFDWVFYVFGAFLIYTAVKLAAGHESGPAQEGAAKGAAVGTSTDAGKPAAPRESRLVRLVRRFYPTVEDYHGTALTTRIAADGRKNAAAATRSRRALTPMALVILAIGATDVLFALDSIPAVFGLTQQPYIVFTANAFALLGLRQLYFLIGGLLDRLVYLSTGLSVVLGFIGLKMIVEALHGSGIEHLGPIALPTVSIPFSLGVIVFTLAVTTVLSLTVGRRRAPEAASATGPER
ncbi:MAG TPA: TerC family protein [Actinocrinis sp.]|uniref:TerC family protein n=1 Tax=Actinocrinis sp. TaxID=1920516 RepID=UPI002D347F80|nr:TerC family protein [Actinocrinis sp.]HZU54376.1 TerC family protein [Actinocrinis sp.]